MPKPLTIVLSINAEEEWDWSGELPTENFSTDNATLLQDFQLSSEKLGLKPSYLFDYALACNSAAVAALYPFVEAGRCEVGALMNPWATPPMRTPIGDRESRLKNLPDDEVSEKLDNLVAVVSQAFGTAPVVYRNGRWGISESTLELIASKGFTVDASVNPFMFGAIPDKKADYWQPHWCGSTSKKTNNTVLEVPVSNGFNRHPFGAAQRIHAALSNDALKPLHPIGALSKLGLLRRITCSPEETTADEMQPLIDHLLTLEKPVLHMYLHSSSLLSDEKSPKNTRFSRKAIQKNLQDIISYAKSQSDVQFCTLSEAAEVFRTKT